jgi:tetratricopeptide (TPR) repeat protein
VPGIQLEILDLRTIAKTITVSLAPFESVLRRSLRAQPRYLLGLCYFLTERWQDAATTLEPLWPDQNHNLSYLYVLGIAAGKGGRHDLEERALSRLVEVGQDTPEFHLFMGKAHLNREEYDDAIRELEAAVKANPKLPFVRFNLGLAYLHKQNYEQAKTEFLADVAVDPDTAATYDQLGDVYVLLQEDVLAEKSYLAALKLDKGMQNSRLGLAKIYDREHRYRHGAAARCRSDARPATTVFVICGSDSGSKRATSSGQEELAAATKIMNTQRTKRRMNLKRPAASQADSDPDVVIRKPFFSFW